MSAIMTGNNTKKAVDLMAMLERFRTNPRIVFIFSAAAAIAVLVAALLWAKSPDYRVLYSNISDQDGGSVIAQLTQMNVPYRYSESGGAIMVPADQVYEARLKLAQQGLPKGGAVGFELLDQEKFGISQFSEQVNYQRALEGELSRTMETLGPVRSARVHLAIPKPSLFVREQKQPTASITLNLQPGRALDAGQISAIGYMVSSAVPGLAAGNVTIVDQNGHLLSQVSGDAQALSASQLKFTSQVESEFQQRIQSILAPILGSANVRSQVTAELDFTSNEQTSEQYQPNSSPEKMAIRSRQSSKNEQVGEGYPGGVPGALTNQPSEPASAPIQNTNAEQAQAQAGGQTGKTPTAPYNNRNDETTNFEVDRTLTHTKRREGEVKRLSVAVVVNYVKDKKGNDVAISKAQMDQINSLVREAMGYSAARGDSVSVINSVFTPDDDFAPLPFWKQQRFIDAVLSALRYLVIALVFWIIWRKMFRPMWLKQQELLRQRIELQKEANKPKPMVPKPSKNELEESAKAQLRVETEVSTQHLRDVADQEPRVVALVIRQWLNKDQKEQKSS